jgi:hypothetical protein
LKLDRLNCDFLVDLVLNTIPKPNVGAIVVRRSSAIRFEHRIENAVRGLRGQTTARRLIAGIFRRPPKEAAQHGTGGDGAGGDHPTASVM